MRHETATVVDRGQYADAVTPWEDETWRTAALGWVERELDALGVRAHGPWRVRVRPWSVLARVGVEGLTHVDGSGRGDRPRGRGRAGRDVVWFKANPPGSAFEAGLGAALARWVPGRVVEPLAVDAGRGWALLPDGGELFREAIGRGADGPGGWEAALGQYASMQRALLPYTGEIERLGVPGARTAELPGIFDEAVAANTALREDERARLVALRPRLDEWCEELAAFGVPDALDHADLHDGQLFHPAPGRFTFFDWGDAAISHPFCSFTVPARRVREQYGPDALPRLRDAYLEPWTDTGLTPAELHRALTLATRLGALNPVRAWGRLFPGTTVAAGPGAVAEWLLGMGAEPPL
ncbi:phosphotransferase [Streptomyces sp. S.PB5]|uniref:phosphotransferase n=1 Tax=Streptomyces sp. S.PB5 TaxID=3020844 RepID=UPI0025AF3964|nr:phosphotransferase [Streptomyces sp. S.PB5]MDN3023476.1 phosphotransferase [Streptomyces sp. S.PB5]